jgi:uncharacterized protein (TIGR00255 family)
MTGYGRAVQLLNGREITVELRSVNNRYLDCTVKLPRIFSFAEDPIRQCVKQRVARGKVDVFVTVNFEALSDVDIRVNRPVLEGYLAAMKSIAADYDVRDDVSVCALSRLPDVFTVQKQQQDEEQAVRDLLAVTGEAIDAFNAMREREGEALAGDLRSRAGTILGLVEKIEARSPITLAEYRERLTARMNEVLENTQIDEARILTEAAIYADKIAVDEETVRLRSHLAQLEAMLDTGGPIGRKLDFLMQEMNREINTVGSKASDLEQAKTVVEVKAELEKIREQMQNIE